jgi:predicted permease
VVVAAFAIIGAGLIVGKFIWKKAPQEKNVVLRYATAFPNCGYLGIPVLGGLFGTEGVIYTSAFIMSFNIYMWTFGIKIFSGKSEKWYMPFIRPAIISIVLGIIIFIFSIQLPTPLYDALSMVGGMTSPLAMLLVGSFLADSKLKDIFADKYIYILSILRFIVWPGIMFFALKPFNLPQVVFACCVLISSMPAAANTVILATSYEKNPKFASETVALTTLIALATIPVWMYFITG